MSKNKQPGPGLWLSIITFAIGLALTLWGGWTAFSNALELITVDSFATPGAQTRDLDPGDYEIYALAGEVSIFELDASFDGRVIEIDDLSVTNVDTGEAIPLEPFFSVEGLGRNQSIYDGVARFDVATEGRYRVEVSGDEPSFAVFGASFDSAFDRAAPWLIVSGVGFVLIVVGAIMLIVGIVRRNRAKHQAQYAAATNHAPAGYTPAPAQPPAAATNPEIPAGTPPTTPPPPPPATPPSSDATPWD